MGDHGGTLVRQTQINFGTDFLKVNSRFQFLFSVRGEYASDLIVAHGSNDLSTMYDQKLYAEVEAIYSHPKYNSWALENDIALIKVKKPFNFSDSCQPACLPTVARDHYDGILKVRSNLKSFKGLKSIDLNLKNSINLIL